MSAISGVSGLLSSGSGRKKSEAAEGDFAELFARLQQAATTEKGPLEDPQLELSGLLERYQDRLRTLRRELEKTLAAAGIDTAGVPVRLQLNLQREVTAVGEHPQLAQLQSLLQNDPDLQHLFTQVAELAEQAATSQGVIVRQGELQLPPRFSLTLDGGIITPDIS